MTEPQNRPALLLLSAGFLWIPEQSIWISRTYREAFSENVLVDYDVAWLKQRLADRVPAGEFWFHFHLLNLEWRDDCANILAHLRLQSLRFKIQSGTLRAAQDHSN